MNFDNPAFQIAADFIKNSNRSLFLTGKAGTGKTTFLKHIIKDIDKNKIVLAPTGVAAIHAGGSTIHSFFQLPFGPYVPNTGEHEVKSTNNRKMKAEKIAARKAARAEKAAAAAKVKADKMAAKKASATAKPVAAK